MEGARGGQGAHEGAGRGGRAVSRWVAASARLSAGVRATCGGSEVGAIGAVLARDTASGAVRVRETPAGLAAAEAGLVPGDRVKMVDGVLVDELDATGIKELLRGAVGTEVMLTVVRGDEVLQVEITRQPLGGAPALKPAEQRIE